MPIDWSSLYKKEDWLAVWLGFIILGLASLNAVVMPKINAWSVFPSFTVDLVVPSLILLGFLIIVVGIPGLLFGVRLRDQVVGVTVLYLAAFLSLIISKQEVVNRWGFEYVFWALLIGLILSNFVRLPDWFKATVKSEILIKVGLVLLGAEILLSNLLVAGLAGIFEVTVGLVMVWYFCYFLATRLGLSRSFASILASATSICGVSAAIAAGGAVKGDPKEVSYTISLVLLFAVPMVILMPIAGRLMGLSGQVVGAWIGGTIDTTPAVVAAGALYDDKAMQFASIIKMSQNIMIAFAAFILALYWAVRVERAPNEKPSLMDIWFRFPKFVLGFIMASVLFSILPSIGISTASMVGLSKNLRGWLFSMAFVSIGLNTNFKELLKTGGGKPLIVFTAATLLDVVLSLISAMIFFGGFS
jgi:uncharacterized integral membrane protein (TIGR00698 family)